MQSLTNDTKEILEKMNAEFGKIIVKQKPNKQNPIKRNKKQKSKKSFVSLALITILTIILIYLVWKSQIMSQLSAVLQNIHNETQPPASGATETVQRVKDIELQEEWVFEDGQGKVFIQNNADNSYNLQINVVDSMTGDFICSTSKINPGQYIEELRLNGNTTKKGTYQAIAKLNKYELDTNKILEETEEIITIIIK